MDDCRKCQTFAGSPAEPGELLFLFRISGLPHYCVCIQSMRMGSHAALSTARTMAEQFDTLYRVIGEVLTQGRAA
jgi:hypothetical protein